MKTSIISICIIIWLLSVVSISWLTKSVVTRNKNFNEATVKSVEIISSAPNYVVETFRTLSSAAKSEPTRFLSERTGLVSCQNDLNFPCPEDDGYLLFTGLHPITHQGYVELIKISTGKPVKQWFPDWGRITKELELNQHRSAKLTAIQPLAGHPLINNDGDLAFLCADSIVTMKSGSISNYTISKVSAHHSVELANDGQHYITPGYARTSFEANSYLSKKISWCDSVLKISLDGKVVENVPFYKILEHNNIDGIVFGRSGVREIDDDLIHINQISVAPKNGRAWNKDDLLISARHLSEIFLYRPKENKIVWRRSGPWKNQHSVHFVSDNQIALFDNNVFGFDVKRSKEHNFVSTNDINRIFVIKFNENDVVDTEPFKDILKLECVRPQTVTQGRARVLPDGGVFIEETNFGRHLRLSQNGLMWVKNNRYDTARNGIVSWSRYFTKEEGLAVVKKLEAQ